MPLRGPLVGERAAPINKVIDFNQLRTCKLWCWWHRSGAPIPLATPVPVYSSAGVLIGYAALCQKESVLEAEIFIERESPERLDSEIGEVYAYLHGEGSVHCLELSSVRDPAKDGVTVIVRE